MTFTDKKSSLKKYFFKFFDPFFSDQMICFKFFKVWHYKLLLKLKKYKYWV